MKRFRLYFRRRLRELPRDKVGAVPDLSGRHYRRLLLGGGIVISFAVLVAALVETTLLVERFFHERKQVFLDQRDLVKANLENHQARLTQTVEAYELLWDFHDNEEVPTEAYKQRLEENKGVVVTGSDVTVTPFSLFSSLQHHSTDVKLRTFLRLVREMSPSPLLRQSHTGHFLGGFSYSTDRRFLAIWPTLPATKMDKIRLDGVDTFIASYIDKVETEMSRIPLQELRQHRIVWISLYRSPISGELVTDYAVPVFRNDQRVAVVVSTVPFDKFSQLFQDSTHETGFFVISRDRQHLFGGDESLCDVCLMQSILESPTVLEHSGQQAEITRRDGFFFLSQPIPGPDWIAVYVFDWYSVLIALRYKFIVVIFLTLLVLGSLWGFVLLLDRLVLKPLRDQSRRIFESEAFNRTVLAAAPVGLAVYDPHNDMVVMQNDAALSLLSESSEGDGLYRRLVAARSWGLSGNSELNARAPLTIDTILTTESGVSLDISIAFSQTRYQQREVVLIRLTDVSEQKMTVRLLQRAREAADQASHAKSMFLATMSHEIRTPLHGALGNLELLAMEQLTARQQERVLVIRRSFDALLVLINDILDLSKIEAHELQLNVESFRIDELVERCAQTFSPSILEKGIRFLCLVDPRLSGFWTGDGHRLTQVVMNLLSNAIKFTEKGSITLRAHLGDVRDGSTWVRISVSDTGIGISPERLEGVFDPFVQADRTIDSQYGGTGLGLTLCRRILSLMGGGIRVDSEQGEGSLFTVDVPLEQNFLSDRQVTSRAEYEFSTVVIVCEAPLWRFNLIEQVKCWLPSAQIIEYEALEAFEAPNGSTILVFATLGPPLPECWQICQSTYLDTIILSGDGPLYPERRNGNIYVTSFSASMFQLGLAACGKSTEVLGCVVVSNHGEVTRQNARVLIAEDDPINRTLLENQLAALGYDYVDSVKDGDEALKQCRINKYDIVLTDLGMPVMDGEAFLKAIRSEGIMMPVILSTAATGDSVQIKTLDFSDVLYKPITMNRLKAALEQALGTTGVQVNRMMGTLPIALPLSDMQALFLAGWESDKQALCKALEAGDSKRFLGRLHRLKGALLALGEKPLADACERLNQQFDVLGVDGTQAVFEDLLSELLALIRRFR